MAGWLAEMRLGGNHHWSGQGDAKLDKWKSKNTCMQVTERDTLKNNLVASIEQTRVFRLGLMSCRCVRQELQLSFSKKKNTQPLKRTSGNTHQKHTPITEKKTTQQVQIMTQ